VDYQEYRDRRLREDPELARAYEEVSLEREIARQVLRLRLARRLTQQQLAEVIGTKQTAIARLESGTHRPSLATLEKVCQALGARLEVRLVPIGQ